MTEMLHAAIAARIERAQNNGYAYIVQAHAPYAEIADWLEEQGIQSYLMTWGFYLFKRQNDAFAFRMRWG